MCLDIPENDKRVDNCHNCDNGDMCLYDVRFSFLRNRVVDFTGYIYNYVWLMAALILAAVALYALFNYAGYGYIAGRYIERLKLRDGEIDTAASGYGDMPLNEYSKNGYFHIYEKDRKEVWNISTKYF